VIARLLLIGAGGDLAGRYLFPALAALCAVQRLPDGFQVVGADRDDLGEDGFRRRAEQALDEHARDVPEGARASLLRSLRYSRVDVGEPASVAGAVEVAGEGGADRLAIYLALPPSLFEPALDALASADLPRESRIAIEKPFGEDLESAVSLNAKAASCGVPESAIFRVDHVLGMATVQNILPLRLANGLLASAWSGEHIESITVHWEETLALEGRAGYFDRAGILKDVVQNHALQALSLLAMEPPAGVHDGERADRSVELLRSIRKPAPAEAARTTRRARYAAGTIGDRSIPAYVDEPGVDRAHETETFVEMRLAADTPRWHGTEFVLRAGKALRRTRKGAVIAFRRPASTAFGGSVEAPGNRLWIGLDGPEDLELRLTGASLEPPDSFDVSLSAPPPPSGLPAYGRVLENLLEERRTLSVRGDEAEEAWRVVTPVLEAWDQGLVPLEEYAAGSDGP
jgi:glucose-6-phosphate 1-dehydrogenase